MFLFFSKCWSLIVGFPWFFGGPGDYKKVREAGRNDSSKDHLKRPPWCRVMTKKLNKFTTIGFTSITVRAYCMSAKKFLCAQPRVCCAHGLCAQGCGALCAVLCAALCAQCTPCLAEQRGCAMQNRCALCVAQRFCIGQRSNFCVAQRFRHCAYFIRWICF